MLCSNFVTWQTKVRLLLMRDGVWNIVKGTDEKPKGSNTSLEVKAWNGRNDRALAYIGLGLADNLIHRLDLDKPANELEREGSSGVSKGTVTEIDIPPPRPKHKPTHPYPRSMSKICLMQSI